MLETDEYILDIVERILGKEKTSIGKSFIDTFKLFDQSKKELSDKKENLIKEANKKLGNVANRLSIAFYEEHKNLLFLADLKAMEINFVIQILQEILRSPLNLDILITPHHGTHWSEALESVFHSFLYLLTGAKWLNTSRYILHIILV